MTPVEAIFARRRMLGELRWHTRLLWLKYRVQLPGPRYVPTGRIVNGIYREVRQVAL